MLSKVLVAGALVALTVAPVHAADPPASAEQCHKLQAEMADAVAKATIPAGTKAKLDELFGQLRGHCDAGAFVVAGQTMAAIRDTAGLKN